MKGRLSEWTCTASDLNAADQYRKSVMSTELNPGEKTAHGSAAALEPKLLGDRASAATACTDIDSRGSGRSFSGSPAGRFCYA